MGAASYRNIAMNGVAVIAIFVLWNVFQVAFNVFFFYLGQVRGDPSWWFSLMKNFIGPAASAVSAFMVIAGLSDRLRFSSNLSTRFLFFGFVVLVLVFTITMLQYNAEYYLPNQRIEEWRDFFWGASQRLLLVC